MQLSTNYKISLTMRHARFSNFPPFAGILSKIEEVFGLLVIQLVWYNVYTKTVIQLGVGESGAYLPSHGE